jgi:hypothetical protein
MCEDFDEDISEGEFAVLCCMEAEVGRVVAEWICVSRQGRCWNPAKAWWGPKLFSLLTPSSTNSTNKQPTLTQDNQFNFHHAIPRKSQRPKQAKTNCQSNKGPKAKFCQQDL